MPGAVKLGPERIRHGGLCPGCGGKENDAQHDPAQPGGLAEQGKGGDHRQLDPRDQSRGADHVQHPSGQHHRKDRQAGIDRKQRHQFDMGKPFELGIVNLLEEKRGAKGRGTQKGRDHAPE